MKKFLVSTILAITLFSAHTEVKNETCIKEFFDRVNPLLQKNQQYKKMELGFKLNERLLFSEFASWMPSPYIDLNSSFSGVKIDKLYNGLDVAAALGISQKLPLGMNLNLAAKQSCGIFFDNKADYSYKFNTAAGLSVPLWFMAPSALPDFVKQEFGLHQKRKQFSVLEKDKEKKNLIIKMLSAIGSEKILKKKIELLKNLQKWNTEEKEKNEILFSQGKLSVLDFSEKDKKIRQAEILLFQAEQNYEVLMSEIETMGLAFSDLSEDMDSWLDFFEKFAFYLQEKASAGDELKLLQHEISWMQSVQKFNSSIPRLSLSFGADVLPSKDHYSSFPAAFMGYWKNNPRLKWKVSMNVKINLSPLHDDFKLNKNFKILQEINSLDEDFLRQSIENEKNKGLKNVERLLFTSEMSKSAFEIQKKYFTLAEELYKQGKNSMHDLYAAKNLLEEAEINYYSERLAYILNVLQVYNF